MTDLDKLWNKCVHEKCKGIGGRHMYVLIAYDGMISSGGILNEVENIQESEADNDAEYTFDDIIAACDWAESNTTWASAKALRAATQAARSVLAQAASLPEAQADELLEAQEGELDGLLAQGYDDDWLTELLAHKFATAPEDFARPRRQFGWRLG